VRARLNADISSVTVSLARWNGERTGTAWLSCEALGGSVAERSSGLFNWHPSGRVIVYPRTAGLLTVNWLEPTRGEIGGLADHPVLNIGKVREKVTAFGAKWIVGGAQVDGLRTVLRADRG
jgi:hypothetical protein